MLRIQASYYRLANYLGRVRSAAPRGFKGPGNHEDMRLEYLDPCSALAPRAPHLVFFYQNKQWGPIQRRAA